MAYLYLKYSSSSMSPKTTALKGTSFFKNARHATLSSNIIVRNKKVVYRTCASIIVVQDYMVKTRIYCRICIERTFNNNRFSLADQIVWLNVLRVIMFPS